MSDVNRKYNSGEMDAVLLEQMHNTWGISALKEHQKKALTSLVIEKRDTLICVPTGSGKSICYEAITTVADHVKTDSDTDRSDSDSRGRGIVLVISPLVALLSKQVSQMNELGVAAVNLLECLPSKTTQHTPCTYTRLTTTLDDLKAGRYR